jgi:hypothetical protein
VRELVGSSSIQPVPFARHEFPVFSAIRELGLALALTVAMETLIDPFELHTPGSDPIPAPRMRPRMQSIVIDVEWDDPPPAPSSRGVRIWETE